MRQNRLPRDSARRNILRRTQTQRLAHIHPQHKKPSRVGTHKSIHTPTRRQHLQILRSTRHRSRPRHPPQQRRNTRSNKPRSRLHKLQQTKELHRENRKHLDSTNTGINPHTRHNTNRPHLGDYFLQLADREGAGCRWFVRFKTVSNFGLDVMFLSVGSVREVRYGFRWCSCTVWSCT